MNINNNTHNHYPSQHPNVPEKSPVRLYLERVMSKNTTEEEFQIADKNLREFILALHALYKVKESKGQCQWQKEGITFDEYMRRKEESEKNV